MAPVGMGGAISVPLPQQQQQQQNGARMPPPAIMIVPSQQGYCIYFQPQMQQQQSQGPVELPSSQQQLWTQVEMPEGSAELKGDEGFQGG